MTGPELATMTVEEALPYADDVVEKWPTGFSQLDRAALKTLKEEVRRLQGLMPFFARLPSFAAWVEDARVTADEVKRLKATLSDQAAVLRGVLDENVLLRARSEQTPSFSAVAVDALLKTIDELQGFDFDDTKLDAAAEAVRESREPSR